MSKFVTVLSDHHDTEQIREVISKKRKTLVRLTRNYEKLNTQLTEIQHEYDRRIGILFRKSQLMEKEIERSKAINRLMNKGLSYKEAELAVEQEEVKNMFEEKSWDFDFEAIAPEQNLSDGDKILRKLWIKLVQKHHPDLADNQIDRKKKEHMMKVINKAYSKKDYEALKKIEEQELLKYTQVHIDNLEQALVDIENAIIRITKELTSLKESTWYRWRKKTPLEKDELFSDLERSLIREVFRKEQILSDLKRSHL